MNPRYRGLMLILSSGLHAQNLSTCIRKLPPIMHAVCRSSVCTLHQQFVLIITSTSCAMYEENGIDTRIKMESMRVAGKRILITWQSLRLRSIENKLSTGSTVLQYMSLIKDI